MDPIKLQEAISRAGADWQAGETNLSQLSDEQRLMYLGYQPRADEPSLQEREQMARINYEAFRTFEAQAQAQGKTVGYPTTYDLRAGGFVTDIKDQGSCGSCVAFGTVATIETTLRRQRNNPNLNVNLSEAHLFYCYAKAEGMNCNTGWYPDSAMEAAKKGIVDEACFPYTAGNQNCKLCSDWQSRLIKVDKYSKLTNVSAMKEWISTRGALSACFSVYNDFFSYKSGVYRHVTGALAGGHCISIVGYDDSLGCWICKNSWSTKWGDQGFFKIAYGECGIEAWVYVADGITGNVWLNNVKVQGLWTSNADLNSYVYFSDGIGWRRLCTSNATDHLDMLVQLAASKEQGHAVSVFDQSGIITQVYAW